METGSEVRSEF